LNSFPSTSSISPSAFTFFSSKMVLRLGTATEVFIFPHPFDAGFGLSGDSESTEVGFCDTGGLTEVEVLGVLVLPIGDAGEAELFTCVACCVVVTGLAVIPESGSFFF
jgi:hypothetical protein